MSWSMTPLQAARELGVTKQAILYYVRTKRGTPLALPATHILGKPGVARYLIDRSDFIRWRDGVFAVVCKPKRASVAAE